ncbi:MAG: hypothetical protein U0L91_01350 [Gemmiger sp.]|uniref:hypothetical protein n=1 Tax=Gemmiger sp. TaxID=2049027 RepID=UPI002E7A44C4|nr:hypothetical protein [Gemmiger sp.]MEE0799905.1 hypothetical protein [Gemmiger sp.]
MIDPNLVLYILALIGIGILGVAIYPEFPKCHALKAIVARCQIWGISLLGIMCIPNLYRYDSNAAMNTAVEYQSFTSSGFDMEIAGYYQFLARDCWLSFLKPKADMTEYYDEIDEYLEKRSHLLQITIQAYSKGKISF